MRIRVTVSYTHLALYDQGKTIEILAGYEPHRRAFGEWWKQLFGESEGKDGKRCV